MTSRLLLFYSLFSEINFNWQRKRTLWKKVFLLKGNSANPCLVRLPNFNGVWLKLCHEQYFFKDTL